MTTTRPKRMAAMNKKSEDEYSYEPETDEEVDEDAGDDDANPDTWNSKYTNFDPDSNTGNTFESESASSDEEEAPGVTLADGKMYSIIGSRLAHDKKHFTQGLTYSHSLDALFESIGLYGKSAVCKLDPYTGDTILCSNMETQYFGEGIQVYGKRGQEKLIQLTWKSNVGFIYDARSLKVIQQFGYSTTRDEGWGICIDKKEHEFIVSDGSGVLHFWDVDSLEEKRTVSVVRQSGEAASNLNELEFMGGKILANVWYDDVLLVINPTTGQCEMEYDFSMLWSSKARKKKGGGVLNGISVSNEEGVIYMTGKNWDRIFNVKLNTLKKNQEPS